MCVTSFFISTSTGSVVMRFLPQDDGTGRSVFMFSTRMLVLNKYKQPLPEFELVLPVPFSVLIFVILIRIYNSYITTRVNSGRIFH